MALKWAFAFSHGTRTRWLVALMYVIGFSLGVHQLNLLALPAISMIIACRRCRNKKRVWWRLILAFAVGCAVVAFILKGLMPWSLSIAGWTDLFAVNTLGLPYWSGAIAFWSISLLIILAVAILLENRYKSLSTALWCLAAVMIGFSVYILIPIRAHANPPVNEGNPSNVFSLADYLDRRQYGVNPLFYGRTPYSRIMREERITINEQGDTIYDYSWNSLKVKSRDIRPMMKEGHIPDRSRFLTDADRQLNTKISLRDSAPGYVIAGVRSEPRLTPELNMWLPRIFASSSSDLAAYRDWTGMDSASMVKVRISEAYDSLGRAVPMRDISGMPTTKYALRPSYLQSLTYMFGYQIGYMYPLYLVWNFCGRQHYVPSRGEIDRHYLIRDSSGG